MQDLNEISVVGVWLPGEVAFNPDLSYTDMFVFLGLQQKMKR